MSPACFQQIPGPVLAVGHSYGEAVTTNAVACSKNVVGLVYLAAFAPDEGETLGEVEAGSKDSVLNSALYTVNHPVGGDRDTAVEFGIKSSDLQAAFAGDLSADQAALLAATQRPCRRTGVHRADGCSCVEDGPFVGGRSRRRQGSRDRRDPG
jgi:pimeloyl-ACP methyl ester carboxylesterase